MLGLEEGFFEWFWGGDMCSQNTFTAKNAWEREREKERKKVIKYYHEECFEELLLFVVEEEVGFVEEVIEFFFLFPLIVLIKGKKTLQIWELGRSVEEFERFGFDSCWSSSCLSILSNSSKSIFSILVGETREYVDR